MLSAMRWVLVLCGLGACSSINLGDSPPVVDPLIDEDFFYCRIMPEIIVAHGCASGMAGETCHSSTSAMLLDPLAEAEVPPTCDGNTVVGAVPETWEQNLEGLRCTVRSDPYSSPFLLRPLGVMNHERIMFDDESPEAMLIVEWLTPGY